MGSCNKDRTAVYHMTSWDIEISAVSFSVFIIPHLMTYPQDLPERVSKHVDNLIASYHTL